LGELVPVARADAPGGWGPASYYRFAGALGTLGVISPLSHHFCGECNRLRLTADGRLRTCLFSDDEIDVRAVLRGGTDADVRDVIRYALAAKPAGHDQRLGTVRRMSQIGG
jgi:cyclic pyranopterin phosphate synthase